MKDGLVDDADIEKVGESILDEIEADCFWCLTKLLDGIQDHYTFAQPGIQRQVSKLKELITRIDSMELYSNYLLLSLLINMFRCV